MAYVFRIHEPKKPGNPAPVAAANMAGWTQTGHISGNLLSNITLGLNGNKMGTSIPSIFARIFLFEGAFQTLNGQPLNVMQSVTTDTRLVSECFDLIEFLFQHGNDSHLIIKRWNAQSQIQGLRSSGFDEHKQLAQVLEDEILLYPNLNEIFLFYWKTATPQSLTPKEFLIGGTSPYTMVFTSPNWRSSIKKNNLSFSRLDGNSMFDENNIASLKDRDSSFKDMLYSLHMAFNAQLAQQARYFDSYIAQMMASDTPGQTVAGMASNPGAFLAKYTCLTDVNGTSVSCPIIPICFEKIQPTTSGYEIVPTSSRYQNYVAQDGSNIQLNVPLVLNNNGLRASVPYIGASPWNVNTCIINEAEVRTTELHKRVLPGQMGVVYPYLIWSDFLEDKIIKLPYSQDSNNFVTACDGEEKYVLPLKRTFFKYFNIDDISSNVQGTNKKLVEVNYEGSSVVVRLNVPIRDLTYHYITLERKYEGSNVIESTPFLLGFFPFYKVADDNLNRYNVMKCGGGINLRFYKINQIDAPINAQSTERTAQGTITSQTEYYSIRNSFDIVEVISDDVCGVILPKMTFINNVTEHYKFAVDFGTSNTYIAHITNGSADPSTLEVDEHDQQTVFLTDRADKGPRLNAMKSHIAREFAPVSVGQGSNISYPCRTAICETPTFTQKTPELFGSVSIGFNMMNEPQASNAFVYKTGLKWLLEQYPGDVHHTNRVKFYFLQTLWMLKNESYLNGGDDRFDVYITFPETMKVPTRTALMSLWESSKQELRLNCNFFYGTQFSESIAPYNCMATKIGGSSYLNIDIGGGTNDLLFVLKNTAGNITAAHYSSAMFAGDDLWGDGIVISANQKVNNGFVECIVGKKGNSNQPGTGILGSAASYPVENISTLEALMGGVSTSSADIMGYLFKNDGIFATSGKIQGNRNLYSIVFIHYAAILYNVARLIKKLNIDIPAKLSFTGMGSKYINLMSGGTNVFSSLTILLLEKYTGKKIPNGFEIINSNDVGVDVKEITAKGVLEGLALAPGFQIPSTCLSAANDLGFDTTNTITYSDVAQDNVRKAALQEFHKFVNTLREEDFKNFLFQNFSLNISEDLLNDLCLLGEQSFTTMSASIPPMYNTLQVQETLFFWPLKNSLVELSKRYKNYN